MYEQYGYQQNSSRVQGTTPFVTQGTDKTAIRVFQGDEMLRQLIQLNNTIGTYAQQNEKRFQYVERKKRRACTRKYLCVGTNGVILLVETYDDGAMESKNFFTNVSGKWSVFRVKFAYTEEISSQFVIRFASGVTVIGNADKNTEAEIYRDFIKAGVTFDPGNSLSCIKRILYETFAPEITNCSGIMTIPELAGWYNKKFLSASSEIACPKDFFNMPIWDKGFVWPNMNKNWQVEFVRLMKNIRSSDTRLSCITILAAGIMASILQQHGMKCKNYINFVMLDTTIIKKLIQFFAVFNRQAPTVIMADETKKCISAMLSKCNDEVVIVDALVGKSSYEKQKIDKNLYLLHKKIIDVGNTYQINRDVNATMIVINRQVSVLRGAINIFVDRDFGFSGEQTVEPVTWFITALVNYIQGNFDYIESVIDRMKDEAYTVLQIVWRVIQMFFESQDVDIAQELQITSENPFEFLDDYLDDKDELIRLFVIAVRKSLHEYFIREKIRNLRFDEESIFVTDQKVWIPTKILKKILSEHGLEDRKHRILLEIKNREKLFTDGEGLSMRVQIGEVRKEAYVFAKNIFELPGHVPFDSLGKEDE